MLIYRYSLNLTRKVFKNPSIVSVYFKSGKAQVHISGFHSLESRKIPTTVNLLNSIPEISWVWDFCFDYLTYTNCFNSAVPHWPSRRFYFIFFWPSRRFQIGFQSQFITCKRGIDMHSTSTFQNEGLVENYLSKFLREKKYNFNVMLKLLEEKISFIICKRLE